MTRAHPTQKILCIDTDAHSLGRIKAILAENFEADAVQFHAAESGEEGLELVGTLDPDIVLCDVGMEDLGCYQAARRIRNKGSRAAIFYMAESDDGNQALKARQMGADGFLAKPLDRGALLLSVTQCLRMNNLRESVQSKTTLLETCRREIEQMKKKMEMMHEDLKEEKRRMQGHLGEMERARQKQEAQGSQITMMNEELTRRFDSTVGLLANIIELHQVDHRGHSERVADIAVFIAGRMDLSDTYIQNVRIAARLHELGIVSLPRNEKVEDAVDESKSRKYTNHPLVGEMLLKGFPGFEMIADMIRHMNENVDGSGNPDGLIGDRIPIGSRIISVSSYFDHQQLAHRDKSPGQVFEIVEKLSGTFFDENVVFLLGDYLESRGPEDRVRAMECSVFALREGMELASDVYSESGINLLRKGTVLSRDILSRVLKFNHVDPVVGNIKVKLN